jgi:hypothetical protein
MTQRRDVEPTLQQNVGVGVGVDVFDEHIEEMMKIIVAQGRRICEELKRVQQVKAGLHHSDYRSKLEPFEDQKKIFSAFKGGPSLERFTL